MVDKIVLDGNIREMGAVKVRGITRTPTKPLIQDKDGNLWLGKRLYVGDEHIREFLGYHLQALLYDFDVLSPKIRTHPDYPGYLVEYLPDMEPKWWFLGDKPVPDWVPPEKRHRHPAGQGYISKPITDRQVQHLVACFANDDFDRHVFNYGILENKLVVLDQCGGSRRRKKEKMSFGGSAIYEADIVRDEKRRYIKLYSPAINILMSADNYFREVIDAMNLSGKEQTRWLDFLRQNLENIESTLSEVFQYNREHQNIVNC